MSSEKCALLAQIIPVLMLVIAVGDGYWIRVSRKSKGNKIHASFWIVLYTAGELCALWGAVFDGLDNVVAISFAFGAALALVGQVGIDVCLRIWEVK